MCGDHRTSHRVYPCSMCLKTPRKKSAMGSVSTVQLTPSKRGKNMIAVSTVNDKEWHGRLNEFNYYTYNTYLKSEVDAQIAGVVTETCRYGLPLLSSLLDSLQQ